MKLLSLSILLLALSGCGLTPDQLQAMDGAMCNKARAAGMEFTTAVVAGSSKNAGMAVDGETCSITTGAK